MTNTSLADVLEGIQSFAKGASGSIRVAPIYAPDQLDIFPASICYPKIGEVESQSDAWYIGLHDLILEIHEKRGQLRANLESVIPIGEAVYEAFLDDATIGGVVDTIVGSITYEFGPMAYGGDVSKNIPPVDTIGWRFTIRVKLKGDLS